MQKGQTWPGTSLASSLTMWSVPLTQAPTMMPSAMWWWSQEFLTKARQMPLPCFWTSKNMIQINFFPDNMPSLRYFVIATENGWIHQTSLITLKSSHYNWFVQPRSKTGPCVASVMMPPVFLWLKAVLLGRETEWTGLQKLYPFHLLTAVLWC